MHGVAARRDCAVGIGAPAPDTVVLVRVLDPNIGVSLHLQVAHETIFLTLQIEESRYGKRKGDNKAPGAHGINQEKLTHSKRD